MLRTLHRPYDTNACSVVTAPAVAAKRTLSPSGRAELQRVHRSPS